MTYEYRHATVDRIIDGDTAVISIDLGNKLTWRDSFRLNGIDTPERGTSGSLEAIERLKELISVGLSRVQTHKPDKFGRWLATLWVSVDGGELNVNQVLVAEGLAREYFGGKK